jgi:hypothetical protein
MREIRSSKKSKMRSKESEKLNLPKNIHVSLSSKKRKELMKWQIVRKDKENSWT